MHPGLSILLAAALSGTAPAPDQATPPSGQQVEAGAIVDHDYAFRLAPVGDGWRLMPEEEIRKISPDARAGLVRTEGTIWGVVIAEHVPGVELTGYVDLLLENMQLEEKQVLGREPLEFRGQPAVRFIVEGRVEGLQAQFANLAVIRGEWAYQVMAWGLASAVPRTSDLFQVHDAFSFLEGPVRERAIGSLVSSAHGPGWRLRDGIFESARYRLSARPSDGWRLVVGDELKEMNDSAEIGLAHRTHEIYMVVIAEVATGEKKQAFADSIRAQVATNLDTNPEAQIKFKIDGKQRTFDAYTHDVGIVTEYLHAAWFKGDTCYQLLAWYPAAFAELARTELVAGFASLDFMARSEALSLLEELKSLEDLNNWVGADSCLRNGIYRNFAHGVSWEKPAEGIWEILVGQRVRQAEGENAVLVFTETGSGINGTIVLEEAGDMTAEVFHRAAVGLLTDDSMPDELPEARPIQMAGIEGRITDLPQGDQAFGLTYSVVSFLHENVAARIVFYATEANLRAGRARVVDAARGFGPLAAELAPRVADGRIVRDWRLGFALHIPEGFSEIKDITPENIAAIGAILHTSSGQGSLSVLGLSPAIDRLDHDFFMQVVEPMLKQRLGARDLAQVACFDAKLGGRDGTGCTYDLDQGRLDIYSTAQGRTIYGLIIEAKSDEVANRLRQSFSLLD